MAVGVQRRSFFHQKDDVEAEPGKAWCCKEGRFNERGKVDFLLVKCVEGLLMNGKQQRTFVDTADPEPIYWFLFQNNKYAWIADRKRLRKVEFQIQWKYEKYFDVHLMEQTYENGNCGAVCGASDGAVLRVPDLFGVAVVSGQVGDTEDEKQPVKCVPEPEVAPDEAEPAGAGGFGVDNVIENLMPCDLLLARDVLWTRAC